MKLNFLIIFGFITIVPIFTQSFLSDSVINYGNSDKQMSSNFETSNADKTLMTSIEKELCLQQGFQNVQDIPLAEGSKHGKENEPQIYPVETNDMVNVVFPEEYNSNLKGTLLDSLENKCANYDFSAIWNQIDLSTYTSGPYLLQIKNEKDEVIKVIRLVKQ